jgi:hypothetical protein
VGRTVEGNSTPEARATQQNTMQQYGIIRASLASFIFPSDRSVQKRKLACRTLYYSDYPY